jgi:hypothetical protein
MKRILPFFILLVSFLANAQVLSISDITPMLFYNNDQIDTYLSNKGFEFEGLNNLDDCDKLNYYFKLSEWQREFITKYNYKNGRLMLTYSIFDVKAYSKLKQEIKLNGFEFISQESYEGKLILHYKKGKIYLSIWSGKAEGESYTAYEFNLSNQEL